MCVGVWKRQYCTKDNIRNKPICGPYTTNLTDDDKVLKNKDRICLHASCWMSWCKKESTEDEQLHLTISNHYLCELSIAHAPASVALGVLQRDVSTFNLSQVHHQIFMPVLRRDAKYTFYWGLFVVCSQECITSFWSPNHWRESSSLGKWLSSMSTNSGKAHCELK